MSNSLIVRLAKVISPLVSSDAQASAELTAILADAALAEAVPPAEAVLPPYGRTEEPATVVVTRKRKAVAPAPEPEAPADEDTI